MKEEEIIKYNIENILEDAKNYLIYGSKESGKTILLDKMFIESIAKFNKFDRVPVIVKFTELMKNDIRKTLIDFLSIPNNDLDEFLLQNNVIIFIDDMLFAEKAFPLLSSLRIFLSTFPKVKLVATANQVSENLIPVDYLNFNPFFKFNLAFIQNFSSKEIKQLIFKWFAGKEIDLGEKMEKLIKSFTYFGLPKTPLSITLFLWIFEKQEKSPINNSVLVEIFIENLLEKTNIENIYTETFDFKNKQRLLSFISKYMKDNGDENYSYSVDYVDLLKYMNDYLKTRFTGQPQRVLEDFIKRGILCYEDINTVRFKSAFFFHYFLALHFDYDQNFKQTVFSENNFLDYIEEISYYTGLKRDSLEILTFSQQKLSEVFEILNENIRENHSKIDHVLEIKSKNSTFARQIDESTITEKPTESDIDAMYDDALSNIPVQKIVPKKQNMYLSPERILDKVLKLACTVLKKQRRC